MKITEAIHEVLKANYEPLWAADESSAADRAGYQGEFILAGQLRVHGDLAMCGLGASDWFTIDDIAHGLHDVYLAYHQDEELGAYVTAVALVVGGTTPEALLKAHWEDEADDVNCLSDGASAIYSSTPDNWGIAGALNLTVGEPAYADAMARVAAEFAAQAAAGSRTPLLDMVVNPSNGANTFVFPTTDTNSNSILIGRDESGTGVGIIWSDFEG
ncbi:hypothetical protein [Streptomyces sp. CoH27]|uniref:hypothetical protein n=1 Tax=Streptomyces sp. CoH27 TaxID=2875763 RepID=UPI001CD363D4|nr:hypothetical protein [Streptomyces sp. CoH27]